MGIEFKSDLLEKIKIRIKSNYVSDEFDFNMELIKLESKLKELYE